MYYLDELMEVIFIGFFINLNVECLIYLFCGDEAINSKRPFKKTCLLRQKRKGGDPQKAIKNEQGKWIFFMVQTPTLEKHVCN